MAVSVYARRRPALLIACRPVCGSSTMRCLHDEEGPAMATAEQIVHVSEFTNEPFIDFTKAENRARMQEALKKVKAEFGSEYPMWLNGKKGTTTEKRTSRNPSGPTEIIGFFQKVTADVGRTR